MRAAMLQMKHPGASNSRPRQGVLRGQVPRRWRASHAHICRKRTLASLTTHLCVSRQVRSAKRSSAPIARSAVSYSVRHWRLAPRALPRSPQRRSLRSSARALAHIAAGCDYRAGLCGLYAVVGARPPRLSSSAAAGSSAVRVRSCADRTPCSPPPQHRRHVAQSLG
jgi:hypothetical protein